ncbi:MAG: hypothetical protein KAV00_09265 [Phycisphaerae bacterium]|nr:hypothetical protein [Phycisphaerae bacterium]
MFGKMSGSIILVCLVVPATGYAEKKAAESTVKKKVESSVKLWDVGAKNSFTKRFKNRNLWKQVPYGTTDYKFENDVVLENDFFCIYFSSRYACDFHGKVRGQPRIWRNCLYRVFQDPRQYRLEERPGQSPRSFGRHYGYHGIKRMKIIKNTPEEVVVEHEGLKYPIPATLRVLKDKPWVQVTPLHHKEHTEQGIHGKVRIVIAPNEKGNDYVVDCLRDPGSRPKAPPCKMLICFYESGSIPFMWVISFSSPFAEAAPYVINDSGPKGDRMWWHGTPGAPRASQGCITSSWARYGKKGSVVVGGLTYWHNWHREEISKPIKKGEVYTSKWKPPYPGKWRMTVRIAEKKYDQGFKYDGKTKFPARYFSKDVNDGKFTFKIPKDGVLDYVIMYMYDRTVETPKEILTPMDQYRWTIRQKKQKKE